MCFPVVPFVRTMVVFLFGLPLFALGQGTPIHIDDTQNIEDVVKALQGPGTEITNITHSVPGQLKAIGYFEDTEGLLGLKKGLIMTTGAAQRAAGPNNSTGTPFPGGGDGGNEMIDPDLATIVQGLFFNIAIVEFDIKTSFPKFSFSYVFGSEEYPEFVGGRFNDTFGFFISGPGINGSKNLALLDNGDPISVNSINPFVNSEYFISNGAGNTPDVNHYLQYDGHTKKLVATTNLIINETYHVKLIIADVADPEWDTGVFIEQESFVSEIPYEIIISYQHNQLDYAIEGCNNATITIERSAQNAVDPLELELTMEGNAENGNDFTLVQEGPVILAPGELTFVIPIEALADALTEGDENIIARFKNPVTGNSSTAKVIIRDEMNYVIDESTICSAIPTVINSNPEAGFTFNWEANNALSCLQCPSPIATLTQSAVFPVEVTHLPSGCVAHPIVSVIAKDLQYQFNDETICHNTIAPINKAPSPDYSYNWTDNQGLSCLQCPSPSVKLLDNTRFQVEVEEVASGCKTNSELTVNVHHVNFSFGDVTVCDNTPTVINTNPAPGYEFAWEPHATLSCTNCPSPSIVLNDETSLGVMVRELANGCEIAMEVPIGVNKIDYMIPDSFVCEGTRQNINTNASQSYRYRWAVNPVLSCTDCVSPQVQLNHDTSFPVEVEKIATGCKTNRQAFVKVNSVDYHIPSVTVCQNEPAVINSRASGQQYKLQWEPQVRLSCLSCLSPYVTTDSDLQLHVRVEDTDLGCATRLTVPVRVAKINYPVLPEEVCQNTLSIIHEDYPDTYSFTWLPDEKLSCLNCSSPSVVLQEDATFQLMVTDNASKCKTTVSLPVHVKKIVAHFTYTATDHYSSIETLFSNQSEGANEYYWDFGDEHYSSEFEPTHTYNPIGETVNVQLTAINSEGLLCAASYYTVAIPIHESVFIPNIITPNDDAYNQYFEIKGIEKGVWRLIVFNTWGNRVYSSPGYQNDWYAENISPGVYYYELQNPHDKTSFKGWLHILR